MLLGEFVCIGARASVQRDLLLVLQYDMLLGVFLYFGIGSPLRNYFGTGALLQSYLALVH